MAIPALMTRFVISGTLPLGEEFATSFWSDQNCPTTQAQATASAINVRSTFETTMLATLTGRIPAAASYDKVTVYAYPSGGPLAGFVGESTITAGSGTATVDYLPPQSSLVVTLLTGLPGRRRRGRMYWPILNATLAATGQYDLTLITAVIEAQENFFNGLQGLTTAHRPVVLSQVGAGSAEAVTALRADSKVDIQRRRSESSPADQTYQQAV